MTGWRTAVAFMAELAVLLALFVAIPACLYLLAWSAGIAQ